MRIHWSLAVNPKASELMSVEKMNCSTKSGHEYYVITNCEVSFEAMDSVHREKKRNEGKQWN